MSQIQSKFIANGAITIPKLGTVTDGVTLDQAGSGSSIEIKTGGVSNTQINSAAAIAYSKLAPLGGSTNDILIQNGSGNVAPSSILSTNLFLADGSVAATSAFNMNSHQINNVSDPSSAQDAATKAYVDSVAAGLFWQAPVKAIAQSNVPLTGSTPLTIDGYTVLNNDRLILANQTTAAQNSVYTAAITGGTYALTPVIPAPAVGDAWLVLNGTVYADSGFVYSAATVFTQFSSAPIAYTAGSALTLTGHQFSVNVDNSTIDVSSNNLEVKAGGITNTQISASAAIAFSKLAPLSSGNVVIGNASNVATQQVFTGDISLSNAGVTAITATSNATLATLSALTTASSLSTVGTITTGTWNASTIAIAHGGTGQTTAAAAFAALSPMTTAGDIIYENATPAPARLPIGTTGQVLTVVSGLPAWSAAGASGTTTVGTFNSQASSANGLVISGVNLYAQAPTATNPGMVSIPASASGLSLSTAALSVATDSSTTKINGSNQVEALASIGQNITLASGDITSQFVDLAHAIYGTSASVNSAQLSVVGGPVQQKTVDYTVSLTGGAGGVTRITFAGDLATGGNAALVSGDILMLNYSYLA